MASLALKVINTSTPHDPSYTYVTKGGGKHRIDYVATSGAFFCARQGSERAASFRQRNGRDGPCSAA
eukprot:1744364-Pyramimonas_sp.AAC.1